MPKISAYPAGGAIQALDEFVIARTGANYKIRGASFMPASGYMVNGYIQPGVAANNLTLSLLTMAGTPPSATDPVYIRIGNAWRAVTAPLSVTANAGTNWMNLGSTELAAKEADLFAYAGYNSTDGVVLGFSRIPYATMYSDFNTTSTNERYARISTILNAAAGDQYAVIGRFAATLSVGAGYTWTQPVSTFANLIQRPIYNTRVLNWLPVGTTVTIGNGVVTAKYQFVDQKMFWHYELVWGNTTSITGGFTSFTLPMGFVNYGAIAGSNPIRIVSAGGVYFGISSLGTSPSVNVAVSNVSATYLTNTGLSPTIPATFTTNDGWSVHGWCFIG